MSEFRGFQREAIQFLADLAANNDRSWFQPRKADYERLLKEPLEVKTEDALKRVPPGYPADHPMADMFRWKDVIFGKRLSDAQVLSPRLPDTLADSYAAAVPVLRFLATLG